MRDTSGGGHDGIAYGDGSAPNGGLRALIYGESNGALEFVGDGWIVTGSLPFDDTLTVAFWMKSDVDPQTFNSAIVGQCNAENGCIGWVIGHQGGNLYYGNAGAVVEHGGQLAVGAEDVLFEVHEDLRAVAARTGRRAVREVALRERDERVGVARARRRARIRLAQAISWARRRRAPPLGRTP